MFTRSELMAVRGREECRAAHRRYFGEIAQAIGVRLPAALIEECRAALACGDEHLNSIQLGRWDAMVPSLRGATEALKSRGDFLSLGTGVCILKAAARIEARKKRPDFLALADRQIECLGKVAQAVANERGIAIDAHGRIATLRNEIAAQMERNFDA